MTRTTDLSGVRFCLARWEGGRADQYQSISMGCPRYCYFSQNCSYNSCQAYESLIGGALVSLRKHTVVINLGCQNIFYANSSNNSLPDAVLGQYSIIVSRISCFVFKVR